MIWLTDSRHVVLTDAAKVVASLRGEKWKRKALLTVIRLSEDMKENGEKKVLKILRNEFMKRKIDIPEGEAITCKKGCAHCCYIKAWVSPEEVRLLKQYVKKNKIKLHLGLKGVDRGRCPFLDSKNECSVYSERPLACRNHIIFSDPYYCDMRNGTNEVKRYWDERLEILLSAFWDAFGTKEIGKVFGGKR